ncbi:hypothetical protein Zmor_005431 [Zophobas morio]|uniref:Uncharacterized protein n=1 Tax=Zophobas morio TaxID=2755281 RepID=A0AA38IUJ8_9CUCU|nr:hypothetical protein Zmor_005431 [Zophobas morio]
MKGCQSNLPTTTHVSVKFTSLTTNNNVIKSGLGDESPLHIHYAFPVETLMNANNGVSRRRDDIITWWKGAKNKSESKRTMKWNGLPPGNGPVYGRPNSRIKNNTALNVDDYFNFLKDTRFELG